VETIDQGIEILTGLKAGELKEDGTFEEETLNYLVDQELQRLAQSWKAFISKEKEKKGKSS
jgi:ATP-dependent Lon protease